MANRFWVGGTAAWDATAGTKWSTTSGGGGGSAVPTAADDVFINSGAGTVTINGAQVCRSLDCTSFTGTLAWGATGNLAIGDASGGAMTLPSTMNTSNAGGSMSFVATTDNAGAGWPVTMGKARTIPGLKFSGVGGKWTLQDAVSIGTSTVTLTDGTLDTNGKSITAASVVVTGTNARTLTLGASVLTLNSTTTGWNCGVSTNFTLNPGTSAITVSGAGTTFAGGNKTYNDVSFTGAGTCTLSGANTFNNLSSTGAGGTNRGLVVQGSTVVNGVFTVSVTYSGTNGARVVVGPNVTGSTSQRNITVNGSYSFTNVDFSYINALGTATSPWTGTNLGDAAGNSNITFATPRNLYWIGPASNWTNLASWSLSTGGASASTCPLPQDNCYIDSNSGVTAGGTFTTSLRYLGKDIDFTGVPNSPTYNAGGFNPGITGSLTWGSGMTITNTGTAATIALMGTSTHTLRFNGVTGPTDVAVSLNAVGLGGTYTLQDNMDLGIGTLTVSAGTFDANGKNISIKNFVSSTSIARTITMGSGTWTLAGTGTVWTISGTGLTFNSNASTIAITDTSVTGKTFAGFSLTYNNLTISGGGTGTVTFSNSATFNNFTVVGPKTVIVNSGLTLTLTGTPTLVGSVGNVITLQSGTPASPFTLSKASGIVSGDYLSIQDSTATGGAAWYAGANSTNVSGNTGWIFRTVQAVSPSSISSLATIGSPTLASTYRLSPASISSTAAVGAAAVTPGAMTIRPKSISSGSPSLVLLSDGRIALKLTDTLYQPL